MHKNVNTLLANRRICCDVATDDFRGLAVSAGVRRNRLAGGGCTPHTQSDSWELRLGARHGRPCHENPRDRDTTVNYEALEERCEESTGRITRLLI